MVRWKLLSGLTQDLISKMAPRTMIDIIEDFNKEMKSIYRLQRASFKICREFKRRVKSTRKELKAMSKKVKSIQKLIKPKAPKSSRVTSTEFVEKDEANDGGKSRILFKTTKGHDQLKSSRIPMEEENLIPDASHEGFLTDKEQPSNSST